MCSSHTHFSCLIFFAQPPADALPAFRDFVVNERQRLTQKRQALVKSEMDKRMAELVQFSQSFKLNKPIPEDLVTILAKDEDKQRAIREKSTKDATSAQARNIAPTTGNVVNARPPPAVNAKLDPTRKPSAPSANNTSSPPQKEGAPKTDSKPAKISMVIQPIPPFKGRTRQSLQAPPRETNGTSSPAATDSAKPGTPTGNNNNNNNNRLNVNATSFRPKSNPFTPGATSPKPGSPKPKDAVRDLAPLPTYSDIPIRLRLRLRLLLLILSLACVSLRKLLSMSRMILIRSNTTRPSSQTPFVSTMRSFLFYTILISKASTWPYNGKRYSQMFPAPQHPPQSHPAPQGPPVLPPPSYEEDSAAQAAARGGYVYYPPYGYPGQPMMPGMPPPGPPGFIPTPYMQPMPYPPGMPPNG